MRILYSLLGPCLFVPALIAPGAGAEPTEAADAIYRNGKIYTVDAKRSWVEAVAIRNGKFVRVGTNADADGWAGPDTVVVDLAGRMAMPGINDLHVHPLDGGIKHLYECSFPFSMPLDDIIAKVGQCAAEMEGEGWIRGGQWAAELMGSDRAPHRSMLDAVSRDHPVFLNDSTLHSAWVNGRALHLLGIDKATPDPDGGVIVRDPGSGEPTGVLLDAAAYAAIRQLPRRTSAEYENAARWAVGQLNAVGVTAMKDALADGYAVAAYGTLDRAGQLDMRVAASLPWKASWTESEQQQEANFTNRASRRTPRVQTDFVKIFLDGIPPSRTAAFLDPYLPDDLHGADFRGELLHDPEELKRDLAYLDRSGVTVKMHATGDAAVRSALDAIEAARTANGDSGLRHEVSHAETIHPDDLKRFRRLGAVAELCPILWYPSALVEAMVAVLGPERAYRFWPIKDLADDGALMVYGSDWPSVVPSPSPWPGIEAMVTRRDPYGRMPGKLWPQQAIDLASAIEIFTRDGAFGMRLERITGSIEIGKSADMIVLDRNLFAIPPDQIDGTQVQLTILEGAVVYDRAEASAADSPGSHR